MTADIAGSLTSSGRTLRVTCILDDSLPDEPFLRCLHDLPVISFKTVGSSPLCTTKDLDNLTRLKLAFLSFQMDIHGHNIVGLHFESMLTRDIDVSALYI